MEEKEQVHLWEASAFAQALRDNPPEPKPITDPVRLEEHRRFREMMKERGRKLRALQERKELTGK